jgi:hypothetical protein
METGGDHGPENDLRFALNKQFKAMLDDSPLVALRHWLRTRKA